jgi:hypothetical protein
MQKSAAQAATIRIVVVCSFLSKSTDQKLHLSGIMKDLNRKHNKRKYAIACL